MAGAATTAGAPSAHHVVFMNMCATGHVNPTLPAVAELRRRGVQVTYFVEEVLRPVVEAAGAAWRPFRHPGCSAGFTGLPKALDEDGVRAFVPEGTPREAWNSLPAATIYTASRVLPALLEDLRGLQPPPSVLVYDPFLAFPLVAAHVLQLPAVSFLTMTGPGAMAKPRAAIDALERQPWVQKPRQQMAEDYGADVFKHGGVMESYSPCNNLVVTLPELYAPPTEDWQEERFGGFPFTCVGPMVEPSVARITHLHLLTGAGGNKDETQEQPAVPIREIQEARQQGRRILYISLGTELTGGFWARKFGPQVSRNGGCPEGGRPLSEHTGKEYCQQFWRTCFAAFGGDERLLVVMTLGPKEDTLEGLPPAPANFVLRQAVPQLEMLKLCDAMVTHGGCNSLHEALLHGLPLLVVPVFSDQPANGESVEKAGAGLSFRHPLQSATAEALRDAAAWVLEPSEGNAFRTAARAMAEKLQGAKGAAAAADAILAAAASPEALEGLRRWAIS